MTNTHDDRPLIGDLTSEEARRWVVRLASGAMSDEEMDRFHCWLVVQSHRAAFERQRALWQVLGEARASFGPTSSRRGRRWRPVMRWWAAACLVAALFLVPDMLGGPADYQSDIVPRTLQLEDGSHLMLDAGSAVDVRYDAHRRRIALLRGRAWFRVAPGDGRLFEVSAAGGRIYDIGTAFEVALQGEAVWVTVGEGQVDVIAGDRTESSVRLSEGQRLSYRKGALSGVAESVPVKAIAAWRKGELLFDAVPVDDALRTLLRYRRTPAWVVGDYRRLPPITATFRAEHVDEAIDVLAMRARLRVVRFPGGAMLLRPPPEGAYANTP